MMDWNKIEQLLGIGKAAAEHGPKYAPIAAAVQLELDEHVAEAKKVVEDANNKRLEEEGRLRAEAANKAREAEEKAHADIQAGAEQQAVDRQAKLDAEAAASADAEGKGNVGDATIARRI